MLNLAKVYPQVAELGIHRSVRAEELVAKMELAGERLSSMNGNAIRDKANRATTSWLLALPTDEEPSETFDVYPAPKDYAALASDGSQIAPSRDGAGNLHLINIGEVVIVYGSRASARLENTPNLYFEDADLNAPFGGEEREVTGQVLAAKRDAMEYAALRRLVAEAQPSAIALVDGSLILWHIEPHADRLKKLGTADLKSRVFDELFLLLSEAKRACVPVAGYISAPNSTNVVNLIKLDLCPFETVDCDRCELAKDERSCLKVEGLTDTTVFKSRLPMGARSAVFESVSSNRSSIIEAYPEEHRPCFFYLNGGSEIARIEIPRWVAEDDKLLEAAHALILDQASKGRGYPISIAEAHEQAVVKSSDRESFNRLVEQILVKKGVRFEDSRKSLLKRGGFV